MKKTILFFSLALLTTATFAQKKITTSATVKFNATTSIDPLPIAENKTVVAAIDIKKGTVTFEALIKGFNFENGMMQDHFNGPKWMDSEKNPSAIFKGTITNPSEVNFSKDGSYKANVEGELMMHGLSSKVNTIATLVVAGKSVTATAEFSVKLDDYKIGNAGGKVASEPIITVLAELK